MPKYDERTSRGWPLPHKANKLIDDVERLRQALQAINAEFSELEERARVITEEYILPIESRQDSLDTRMDVIAGQSTEDTEILDARVDAKNIVHPNLGHNVRSLHSGILELDEAIKYEIQEFLGLLRQFNQLAEAQIQGELNARDSYERRKIEIQQESLTRAEDDSGQQRQIESLSLASIQNTVNSLKAHERRKAEIESESSKRAEADEQLSARLDSLIELEARDAAKLHEADETETQSRIKRDEELHDEINTLAGTESENASSMQEQINLLAESGINNALNLNTSNEKRRADLIAERSERESQDEILSGESNSLAQASLRNSLSIHNEAEERRKNFSETSEQISKINRRDDEQQYQIDALDEDNAGLKSQAASLAQANIQTAANLSRANEKRRAGLKYEEAERILQANNLQAQIDMLVSAILQSSVNLHEAISRQKAGLINEAEERRKNDSGQQEQISSIAEASINNSLNVRRESEKRREGFSHTQRQLDERLAQSEYLQVQINELINAVLRNSLNLHETITKRREALNHETQTRTKEISALRGQIYFLAESGMQNALNLPEALTRRKTMLNQERFSRIEQDDGLQEQINLLARSQMRLMLNDIEGRERIITELNDIKRIIDVIYQAVADTGNLTYKGARIASSGEITTMLSDVLSGTNDGEVDISEIPEEVQGEIATTEEIDSMLDEVFPNRS